MTQMKVAAMVTRLKCQGVKVMDFGTDGWAAEIDGMQVFRATHIGNGFYDVKLNERVFPDI